MFEEMPLGIEPSSQARAGLAAIVLHLTIVSVAVYNTRGTDEPMRGSTVDTVRIELPRAPTTHPVPDVTARQRFHVVPRAPAVPPLRLESPHAASLKLDFPKLDQVLATIRSATSDEASGRDSAPGDTAVAASEVDPLPELLGDLTPRYPDELRRVGLSGETLLEYIVDGGGRVAPGSIRVIRASHPAFAQSVIEALNRARFIPAQRAGRSVAVVVRQRIRFQSYGSY